MIEAYRLPAPGVRTVRSPTASVNEMTKLAAMLQSHEDIVQQLDEFLRLVCNLGGDVGVEATLLDNAEMLAGRLKSLRQNLCFRNFETVKGR